MANMPDRILIYDGQCRLCVTAKAGIERLETTPGVRFVPYQSDEAVRCLSADYRPGRPDVAFLVEGDGTIQKGLDASGPAWRMAAAGAMESAGASSDRLCGVSRDRPLPLCLVRHGQLFRPA
jgi:predicted DCC family thiol-disulfide oxidoreductase YuxK